MCRRLIPWGFAVLALGLGILMAILFPAIVLVLLLACIVVCIGLLLIKR